MSFKSFFTNSVETRELNRDPDLRTNYYRNKISEVVETLKELAEEEHMVLRHFDEIHKELHFVGSGFEAIVTLTTISPVECAVDFKINYFTAFGFNRPKNKVLHFYQALKKKLNFKGISLHP